MRRLLVFCAFCAAIGFGASLMSIADKSPSPRSLSIHRRMDEVFAAPEFAPLKHRNVAMEKVGKSATSYLARFFEWVGRIFRFGGVAPSRSSTVVLYPLLAVLIAGLAYTAAYVIMRRSTGSDGRKRPRKASTSIQELVSEDSRNADEWLLAAQALEGKQDYLHALRAIFVATLLRLDAAGIITYEMSKTNGEYLRAVRKTPSFFNGFQAVVRSFDAGWYGQQKVTATEFEEAVTRYREANELAMQTHKS